jgi:NAD(P)H-nitrite reductase large subunit
LKLRYYQNNVKLTTHPLVPLTGVQDSVSFAIRVENRYKGIRSPHKMKSGVSGCVRECAEAQSKDFGMIATENGYNLYVGGNGGSNPIHAELLAADIDEDTVLKYLDRYIMYYILTAERLERTAVWQQKLPGGKAGGGPIEHLKEVIIEDSLGICEELDRRMAFLVETYHDEWVRWKSYSIDCVSMIASDNADSLLSIGGSCQGSCVASPIPTIRKQRQEYQEG